MNHETVKIDWPYTQDIGNNRGSADRDRDISSYLSCVNLAGVFDHGYTVRGGHCRDLRGVAGYRLHIGGGGTWQGMIAGLRTL